MTSKTPTDAPPPLPAAAAQLWREATAAHQAGNLDKAEPLYRRILAIDAKQFPVLVMLAMLHAQRGAYAESENLFCDALKINPDDPNAQFNHGNVLLALQRLDEAYGAFGRALAVNPNFAEAHLNRGSILMSRGSVAESMDCFDAAIRVNPRFSEAYINRAHAQEHLRRFDAALADGRKALALNPQKAEYHAGLANIFHRMKRHDDALDSLSKALSLQPGNAAFHYNCGNVLADIKRFDAALNSYEQAFRIDPSLDYLEGDRFFTKLVTCSWTDFHKDAEHLTSQVGKGRAVSRPFPFLAVESPLARQMTCARLFADREFPAATPLWTGERYNHDRIKVAYLSADFREHAISHLVAGAIEHHSREDFEIIGVSYGADDQSSTRRRMENAFERFVDCEAQSELDIAKWLRAAEIDIAVDLMGPTKSARPAILSHRPAPIQVGYLGFAGSSGAPYIDYVLADRTVIPESERQFYREKVVYLPDTYQANDSQRRISESPPARGQCALPDGVFVFCCFNNPYKIGPDVFDIWMRLLGAVENSVLWLLDDNPTATANLKHEAERRRVRPERLIFAPKVPLPDHLARHCHADLFLDTLPYNGHTTTSDALWAGLPVLTCLGPTFPGRVAASLLKAASLDELITGSLDEYEALALRLARDAARLALLKKNIDSNRLTCALFDTARFTRHVELAFQLMQEQRRSGGPPVHFAVQPID
jgi:protein O-GlcNAc transferase